MSEQDLNAEEILEEILEDAAEGEKQEVNEIKAEKPEHIPPIVAKLEEEVAIERQRREAAEQKLVGVQAKFDELRVQMERETAEMRQRLQRHNEQRMQTEKSSFLTTLLPILDNLGLAIKASENDSSFEHLLEGVKGTARSFEQTLLSLGVEPIRSVGLPFDPELHEAVEMVAVEAEQDGLITAEFSRGYKFGERLLRPARVQVGKG